MFGHNTVYTENILINAPNIFLEAARGATVTIQGAPTYSPVITIGPNGAGSIVQGFIIKGVTGMTGGTDGILLDNVHNVIITRNTITNNNVNGIDLDSSSNNQIKDNKITNDNSFGIFIHGSDNTISGNTINNNADGIDISSGSDNTISGNTIKNNQVDGIVIYGSDNTISGNKINHNQEDGVVIYGSDNTISGNTIIGNGYNGIRIVTSEGNKIIRNLISNNGNQGPSHTEQNGIYLYESGSQQSPNIISENKITGNKFCGIGINTSNGNKIIRNLISNNQYGVAISPGSDNTVSGNKIANNQEDGVYISGLDNTISHNTITGNGYNGILVDNTNGNKIIRNLISNNGYQGTDSTQQNGIYLDNSGTAQDPTIILGNTITRNINDGILLQGTSVADIHYNSIFHNGQYGLEDLGIGTVNAINNWWGSNRNPITSGQAVNTGSGTLVTAPWLKHPPRHY